MEGSSVPKEFKPYQFSIPTLPKRTYTYLKEDICAAHDVTPWHAVLMALKALSNLDEAQQRSIRDEMLKKYPYPGSPSCR